MRYGQLAAGVAATAMLVTSGAQAWGWQGHEAVGTIAAGILETRPATRDQVAPLLRGYSLAVAGVWADCAKSVSRSGGTYSYRHDPFTPSACAAFETPAEEQRLIDFAARNWDNCKYGQKACHGAFHFADVAIQHDAYLDPEAVPHPLQGTSDHDVVHAIRACVAVLKGKPSPKPFNIKDSSEALFLLAHYLGDLHQPLHVGAVYLTPEGQPVDPDAAGAPATWRQTSGGNSLVGPGGKNLHSAWDEVPAGFVTSQAPALLAAARQLPAPKGKAEAWVAAWASDSVQASHSAFGPLTYAAAEAGWRYDASADPQYAAHRAALQATQVEKAGRRLADLLSSIFPG